MLNKICSSKAPAAIGPYSQAIIAGNLVFLSGQIPLCPITGNVIGETIAEQTAQVIRNICNVLSAAGTDISHVVKTTCFLSDMKDFAAFNEVYAESFISLPARSCVAVRELPKGVLVEVEVIAELA